MKKTYKILKLTESQLFGMITETVERVLGEALGNDQKYTVWIEVRDKNGEQIDDFKEWVRASTMQQAAQKIKDEYWRQFQSGRYRICHVEPC